MLISYIGKRVADEVGSGLITTQVIIDYLRDKDVSPAKKKLRHDHDAVHAAPGHSQAWLLLPQLPRWPPPLPLPLQAIQQHLQLFQRASASSCH